MKIQAKEMRKAPYFFYVHLSRELEKTRGNSKFFKGSTRRSNRRKKTQEEGKRGKISQIIEQEKRKHRSALRALKN